MDPRWRSQTWLILFRISQLVWLVSIFDFQDPLKADPTRKPLLTKVAPSAPETAPSAPASSQFLVAAAPFPSELRDGSQLDSLCSGRLSGRPGKPGALSPTSKGWQWESHVVRGGEHSGKDAWPHPQKSLYAEKCHCGCTKVWYYQPHATGKWIKMPLTQQIKLTVK